ncbi:MAG: AIR synthase-related protein, partial [Dehalococcoidia bacterium]|nr:AIR synthase-related protein [Dehalococcoidia bacterium]
DSGVSREAQLLLCDAQTSGGLLIAVASEKKDALLQAVAVAGASAAEIGQVLEKESGLRVIG